MFASKKDLLTNKGNKVKVIGKLIRIDDPFVILKSVYDDEILVRYTEIHKYTDKVVIVTGIVQDDSSVFEEMVDTLDGDFCLETFGKILKISKDCPELFYTNN
ncbi:replication A subunit RPA3 [Tubulinosema ratisbonensis]|uniref:Replication A subunit RPA3 n=1 Tax=Tubulinosema ratisbonensis TaxID=291195 RepID=A0A437AMH6_9MICR|nr:replication A subunit RPA3 [Tubulinosema ratisbonensis]